MKASMINKATNNPRQMSQEEKKTLHNSMQTFGDISSFVFNKRTNELVGGNHRWDELLKIYPEETISFKQIGNTEFNMIMSGKEFTGYLLRIVDWDEAFAKAANISANSKLMMGHFTKDLDVYLDDIELDLDMDFLKGLRLDELRIDIKGDKELKMTKKDIDIFDDAQELDEDIDFDFDDIEEKEDPQQYKAEKSSSISIELDGTYEKGKLYDDLIIFLNEKNYKYKSIGLL